MTTDDARAYADRILSLAKLPDAVREDVSTLLFLAYMQGWSSAVKDEIKFNRRARESA